MPTIFLIRHGESQSNAGLPTTGPESVALTRQGVEQAECVASYLKSHTSLDLIVTSRYLRTMQTAGYTQSLFPSVLSKVWDVHEFTYLSSMHAEQSTTEERKPLVDAYWEQCLPYWKDGPDSESFADLVKRALKIIKTVTKLKDTNCTIAIFSHEQFIKAILWLWKYRPTTISAQSMTDFRSFFKKEPLPNGAIVRISYERSEQSCHYKIIREHLAPQPMRVIAGVQQKVGTVAIQESEPVPTGFEENQPAKEEPRKQKASTSRKHKPRLVLERLSVLM